MKLLKLLQPWFSRLVFDRLRRAEPRNQFPVHLVLEEAHRYVSERSVKHSIDASRVFERIAKEGRKYGMMLLLHPNVQVSCPRLCFLSARTLLFTEFRTLMIYCISGR